MSRELLLVRHGKAEWDNPQGDAARVLTQTGIDEATAVGKWLRDLHILPDLVLCSAATRTQQTWENIATAAQYPTTVGVDLESSLYLAEETQLLAALALLLPTARCVMLVGHNPGIERLATYLTDRPLPRNSIGEVMATANTVHLRLPESWQSLSKGSGELIHFFRPQNY